MRILQDEKTKLWYRNNSDDLCFLGVEDKFQAMIPLDKKDIVLEIGANAGFSTMKMAVQCSKVIAYEPNPAGCQCILKNAEEFDLQNKTIVVNAAIGVNTAENMLLHYNPGHPSAGSLINGKGVSKIINHSDTILCSVESIESAIEQWNPSVVVMDCEGLEWSLLQRPLPLCVKTLAVEFHFHNHIYRSLCDTGKDLHKLMRINPQQNPPMIHRQFGEPKATYGFGNHRNVSFAVWRRC